MEDNCDILHRTIVKEQTISTQNIFFNQANGHLLQLPNPEEHTCNGYCWVNTVVHQMKLAQSLDFMIPNELQYMSFTQSLESFCTTNLSWVLTKSDLTHKFMWLKFWNWGMTYTYHNVLMPVRLKQQLQKSSHLFFLLF